MLLALLWVVAGTGDIQERAIVFPGTGSYVRPIATRSDRARQFFNQGLRFLYAFNHGESKRSFRIAAKADPTCAMAWWGIAMANGPHINVPFVPPDDEKKAFEAIQRAKATSKDARPADRALIEACTQRFRWPQPDDRGPLDRAYAEAMRRVWRAFPNDPDVGALFAESMMDLRPWDLWTKGGKPQPGTEEIVATLERVIRISPKHPFGLHLYIHAVEASPHPERARAAADRLRDLQPGLGHNVHMPSHIDIRLGEWGKAIVANTKAIAADRAYRAKRPQQFVYRIYMAHNHHMLALAAMMTGRRRLAVEHIDRMCAEMPEDFKKEAASFVDGFFAMPFEVRVRFGMWDSVLELPEPPEYFPIARALRHAARGVSFAAMGKVDEARLEQAAFRLQSERVPAGATFGNNRATDILSVAQHLMEGEVWIAEGNMEEAIRELRLAVRAEDALRYDEPPDWIQPARHTLGALLVKLQRFREAEAVYREDLRIFPSNGWSLYGLSKSLEGQGRAAEAATAKRRFLAAWSGADVKIDSSCLCVPGRKSAAD